MSNQAQSLTDAFPGDGALIKPLAWGRHACDFLPSPLCGMHMESAPLSAALLHKVCGDVLLFKPFPTLLRWFHGAAFQMHAGEAQGCRATAPSVTPGPISRPQGGSTNTDLSILSPASLLPSSPSIQPPLPVGPAFAHETYPLVPAAGHSPGARCRALLGSGLTRGKGTGSVLCAGWSLNCHRIIKVGKYP